jgi:hypothetical protein
LSGFILRLLELIKPRAAWRGLSKTYGGKNTSIWEKCFPEILKKTAVRVSRAAVIKCRAAGVGSRLPDAGRRATGRATRGAGLKTRIPVSGQKNTEKWQKTAIRGTRAQRSQTGARAMFFTNNHVKNDMNVSRETLILLTVEKMCIFVVLLAVFRGPLWMYQNRKQSFACDSPRSRKMKLLRTTFWYL